MLFTVALNRIVDRLVVKVTPIYEIMAMYQTMMFENGFIFHTRHTNNCREKKRRIQKRHPLCREKKRRTVLFFTPDTPTIAEKRSGEFRNATHFGEVR